MQTARMCEYRAREKPSSAPSGVCQKSRIAPMLIVESRQEGPLAGHLFQMFRFIWNKDIVHLGIKAPQRCSERLRIKLKEHRVE